MAKMLNLDEVAAKAERVLKIKGKEYEMRSMTVQDFIDITREAEKKEAEQTEMTVSEQMEMLIKMIRDSFPTIPDGVLEELTLEQLNAIFDFIRNDVEDDAEKK